MWLTHPILMFRLCSLLVFFLVGCSGAYLTTLDDARRHREAGELDLALDFYRKAIKQDPSKAELYAELGGLYYERGEVLDASFACEKALQLDPDNMRATTTLARAYLDLGHAEEALPLALRASSSRKPEIVPLWTLAAAFLQTGHFADAERVYRMALVAAAYPKMVDDEASQKQVLSKSDSGYLYLGIGLAVKGQARYQEAGLWLDSAARYIPDEPDAYYERGLIYERQDRYAEALHCYRLVVQYDPSMVDAQVRSAVMLYKLGRLQLARDACLAIYYDYGPDAKVAYTLGLISESRGFELEALDYYHEATGLDEQMAEAWLSDGLQLVKLGDSEKGLERIKRARDLGSSAAKWILESGALK